MKITHTTIRKFLSSCVFNPKTENYWNIISNVDNTDYYLLEAKIQLEQAIINKDISKIKVVIRLLVLACLTLGDNESTK